MQTETQKPQNNKNNENGPKHVNLLCSFASTRILKLTARGHGLCIPPREVASYCQATVQAVRCDEKLLSSFTNHIRSVASALSVQNCSLHEEVCPLAEMIGPTRSRVSCFMNRFRKMGFIDYNGSLQVNRALLTFLLHE
jgi:hypothetical protein